jgi:hypothetical protein
LSVDPDVATTGQPYVYTGDDPLNATDPLGLHSLPPRFWTKKSLPKVDSRKLRNILEEELWKYNAEGHVGNGSSMAAAEEEAKTGRPTEGLFHETKLAGAQNGLQNLLDKNDLTPADRVVANQTLSYVRESLRTFDAAVDGGTIRIGTGPGELGPVRGAASVARFQSDIATTAIGDGPSNPVPPPRPGSTDGGGESGGGDDFGGGVPGIDP